MTARYAGDANFLASSASATHRVNRLPAVSDDGYGWYEDRNVPVPAAGGVLANDQRRRQRYARPSRPARSSAGGIGGTVVLRADGSFDYTPPADANGPLTFAYTAGDGAETTTTPTSSMEVRAVNDPPSFAIGANRTHAAATSGAQTVARDSSRRSTWARPTKPASRSRRLPSRSTAIRAACSIRSAFDSNGTLHLRN